MLGLGLAPEGAALEVGCEGGRWSMLLADAGRPVVCVDVDADALAVCASRIPQATCIRAEPGDRTLPGENGSVALVLVYEVRDVIEADWFPGEAARVLGPGGVLHRHRKLMPTGGERLAWGQGDGSTLAVIDTPFGRVGGLICWENYMPLARAAMYEQGIDVWLAPTWDNSDVWVASMRHIAKEGRCYVVGVNSCLRGSDVPDSIPGRDAIYGGDDDWMSRGNTVIVDPNGDILAGPICEKEGILYAEVDLDVIARSRREFDVVGHYARPDVFRLEVRRG